MSSNDQVIKIIIEAANRIGPAMVAAEKELRKVEKGAQDLDKQFKALDTRMGQFEGGLAKAAGTIRSINPTLTALDTKLKALSGTSGQISKNFNKLEAESGKLATGFKALNGFVDSLEARLEKLDKKLEKIDNRKISVRADFDSKNADREIDQLDRKLDNFSKKRQDAYRAQIDFEQKQRAEYEKSFAVGLDLRDKELAGIAKIEAARVAAANAESNRRQTAYREQVKFANQQEQTRRQQIADAFAADRKQNLPTATQNVLSQAQKNDSFVSLFDATKFKKDYLAARQQLFDLGGITVEPNVKLGTKEFAGERARVEAELRLLGLKEAHIKVILDYDRSQAQELTRAFEGSLVSAFDAAKNSASIFELTLGKLVNTALRGAVLFSGQLLGSLVAVGATLVSVGAAAGVAAAGIAGVATAAAAQAAPAIGILAAVVSRFQAVVKVADLAQKAQDDARENAAGDAKRQITANNALAAAQLRIADAQRGLTAAQKKLNDARKEGLRTLQDMILAEKLSTISADESAQSLAFRIRTGQSGNISAALIENDQQQLGASRTTTDTRAAVAGGVEGLPATKQAVESVRDANRALALAKQGLESARAGLDSTDVRIADSADRYRDALAKLSTGERTLLKSIEDFQNLFQGNTPFKKITDAILVPIASVISQVTELLQDPEVTAALQDLADAIGGVVTSVGGILGSDEFQSFFLFFTGQSADNIRKLTPVFGSLLTIFLNIAKAASGPLSDALDGVVGFFDNLAKKSGSAKGQNDLANFFDGALDAANSFLKLGGAIIELIVAIVGGGGAADEGVTTIDDITKKVQGLTDYINSHQEEVKKFFGDAREAAEQLGGIIIDVGKYIIEAFDSGQVQEFAEFVRRVVIPAVFDFIGVAQDLVNIIIQIFDNDAIAGTVKALAGLAAVGLTFKTAGGFIGFFAGAIGKIPGVEKLARASLGKLATAIGDLGTKAGSTMLRKFGTYLAQMAGQATQVAADVAADVVPTPGKGGTKKALSFAKKYGKFALTRVAPVVAAGAAIDALTPGGLFPGADELSESDRRKNLQIETTAKITAIDPLGVGNNKSEVAQIAKIKADYKKQIESKDKVVLDADKESAKKQSAEKKKIAEAQAKEDAAAKKQAENEATIAAATTVDSLLNNYGGTDGFQQNWKKFWIAIVGVVRTGTNAIEKLFRDMRVAVGETTGKMYRDTRSDIADIQNSFEVRGKAIADSWGKTFDSIKKTAYDGFKYVGDTANDALKDFGGKEVSLSIKAPKAEHKAGGGFLGMRGERGGDTVHALLGRGEAVLNFAHQRIVDPALRAIGINGLDGLFGSVNAQHGSEAAGGFASGGKVGKGVLAPNFGGAPSNVNASLKALLAKIQAQFPDAAVSSSTNHNKYVAGTNRISDHFAGNAIDVVSSNMGGIAEWIKSSGAYKSLTQGIFNPSLSVQGGKFVPSSFWGASTWAQHANHLHLGIKGAFEKFTDLIAQASGSAGSIKSPSVNGNGAGAAFIQSAFKNVVRAANKKLSTAGGNANDDEINSSVPKGASASRTSAVRAINEAMSLAGVPNDLRSAWRTMAVARANFESTFDPTAVNNYDSNALKGTPSKGLFQTIDSTFSAYKVPGHNKIFDPTDNAAAAFRYMLERYGKGDWSTALKSMLGRANVGYASGGFAGAKFGGWHAAGGDFKVNKATLLGVGEAGAERIQITPDSAKQSDEKTLLTQIRDLLKNGATTSKGLNVGGDSAGAKKILSNANDALSTLLGLAPVKEITEITKKTIAGLRALPKKGADALGLTADTLALFVDPTTGPIAALGAAVKAQTEAAERKLNASLFKVKQDKDGGFTASRGVNDDRAISRANINILEQTRQGQLDQMGVINDSLNTARARLGNAVKQGDDKAKAKFTAITNQLLVSRAKLQDDLQTNAESLVTQQEALQAALVSNSESNLSTKNTKIDRASRNLILQQNTGKLGPNQILAQAQASAAAQNDLAKDLQPALAKARKSGNTELVKTLTDEIAEARLKAKEVIAQGIKDSIQRGIDIAQENLSDRNDDTDDRFKSIVNSQGSLNQEQIAAQAQARISAQQRYINDLATPLAKAKSTGNSELVKTINEAITDAQLSIGEILSQSISDVTDKIMANAQANRSSIDRRFAITDITDPTRSAIVKADVVQQAAQSEIDQLTAQLANPGTSDNQNKIWARIEELRNEIATSVLGAVGRQVTLINDQFSRPLQFLNIQEQFANLGLSVGTALSSSQFRTTAGQGFQTNALGRTNFGAQGETLNSRDYYMRQQRDALLGQYQGAVDSGNWPQLVDLTNQIESLDVSIIENVKAMRDNTEAAIRDTVTRRDAITSEGLSINDKALGINASLLALSGSGLTSDATTRSLLTQKGQRLGATENDTKGDLRSLFINNGSGDPSDVAGLRGNELAARLQELNSSLTEANGFSDDQIADGRAYIEKILDNEQALIDNTKALKDLDQSVTQTFSSSAWTTFRQAIFNGNGGLLPQYNIPQMATGGYIKKGGLFELHPGEKVTPANMVSDGVNVDTFNLNVTSPTEVLDPAITSKQIAFGLKNIRV